MTSFLCERRDTLHYQEDLKLDNEKMEAKVRRPLLISILMRVTPCCVLHQIAYLEQDIALTTERLEKEKEDHALTARELQVFGFYDT